MSRDPDLALSPPDGDVEYGEGSIFFVGTATVILRYAGFTVLTDPNFLHAGDHVHLGYGITSTRRTDPAIDIEDLPPIDLVLLSHYHGDHFDRVVQEKLDTNLPIVTTPHAASKLAGKGFRETHALETWEEFRATKGDADLTITAMPGTHAPGVLSTALPPVMGSMLTFRTADRSLRLYVSGDTLLYDELAAIPERYPEIDIGLFHLGGTKLFGVLLTMDAEQGVEAVRLIDADVSIPIHYNDYGVFRSPLSDFRQAVREAGLEDRVAYLFYGDTYRFEVPAGGE